MDNINYVSAIKYNNDYADKYNLQARAAREISAKFNLNPSLLYDAMNAANIYLPIAKQYILSKQSNSGNMQYLLTQAIKLKKFSALIDLLSINKALVKLSNVKNDDLNEDLIPGGKGDNKTIIDIAKKHNLSKELIEKQLQVGIEVEKEHTHNEEYAWEIAVDHLTEVGDYYIRLIRSGLVDELNALQLYKELDLDKEFIRTKIKAENKSNIKLRSLIEAIQKRPLYQIAADIKKDWKNVNYAAKPYLDAMFSLDKITDNYYYDSAKSIVLYFLSNASQWKGDKAKEIKLELKSILK